MKVQITNGMFMALIMNMVYAKAIGLTQGTIAREVGSDMWLSTLFAIFQGVILMLITIWVIRRLPDQDMISQGEVLIGKWGARFISLLVFLFFLGAYGSIMTTYVYHLMDYFLPEAPIVSFIVVAFVVGVYGAFHGLEVMSRMALVGVFSILALNILLMFGSLSKFDIRELLPTFQSGFLPVLWSSRHHDTDWAMATMMAAIILPTIKKKEVWGNSGIAGMLFGGLCILMWPIMEAGVLSAEVTGHYIVACMQMARSSEIGDFLHRYEMIMIAFFAISILIQIMMCLLCASHAVSKLIGLKDYRPVLIPVSFVLSGYGYWLVLDHSRAMDFLESKWVLISLPIAFGLPLIMWILGFLYQDKLQATMNRKGTNP